MNKKSKKPSISIFVTTFNCEAFVEKCLSSIQQQTFSDFECIVVDDCSSDRTPSIVKTHFCDRDYRFKLFVLENNSGPSRAKNIALKHCVGKYIMNCDGDDCFSNLDAFKECFEEMEKNNLDILNFSLEKVFVDHNRAYLLKNAFYNFKDRKDKFFFLLNEYDRGAISRSICTKCIRKSILDEHKYGVAPVTIADDYFFCIGLILCSTRIKTTSKVYYFYNCKQEQKTNSVFEKERESFNEKNFLTFNIDYYPYCVSCFDSETLYILKNYAFLKIIPWRTYISKDYLTISNYIDNVKYYRDELVRIKELNKFKNIYRYLDFKNKVLLFSILKNKNFLFYFIKLLTPRQDQVSILK